MWGAIIAGVVALASAVIGGVQQHRSNKKLAAFQADANEKYQAQQNEYNAPVNQMARFQQAGLNPNLIYGQGSPGNQTAAVQYPDIKTTDIQSISASDAIGMFNQTRLANSQVQAQNASTRQKHAVTELNKLQTKVLEKNPALNDAGFTAIIDGLKASAELKSEQVQGQKISNQVSEASAGHAVSKVFHEVQVLEQRFKLGQLDAKIKAEVLKSKEFQNAIMEVQKKFMTDGDITPGHILTFIQSLLLKAM